MNLKKVAIGILGIVITIIAFYFIFKNINLKSALNHISNISYSSSIILILLYLSTFFIRAFRWKLMLSDNKDITYNNCLKCILIGFAGNNFLPARGGELLRMEFFSRETKTNRITALSSVFVEKILDGLILVIFLFIILIINSKLILDSNIKNLAYFSTILFSVFLFLIIIFRVYGQKLITKINSSNKLILKLINVLSSVYESVLFLRWNFSTLLILISTIIIWLVEGSVFVITLYIFDCNDIAIVAGFLTLVIVNFGILIPSSPGYLGVFQAMTIFSLLLFNVNKELAFSISIIIHMCQYIPTTLWGGYYLLKTSLLKIKF